MIEYLSKKLKRNIVVIVLCSLLLLTACRGLIPANQNFQLVQNEDQILPTDSMQITPQSLSGENISKEAPIDESLEIVQSPTPLTNDSSKTPEKIIAATNAPGVREGLRASDPSKVRLASGEVQLIEFFAFW